MSHAINNRVFVRILIVVMCVALLGSVLAQSVRPAQAQADAEGDHQSLKAGLQSAIQSALGPDARWIGPRTPTQQATLIASDDAPNDQFGIAVALDGSTALVGAGSRNNGTGAAYVFTYDGTTWTQQAILTASDGAANDQFGYSVALSGDTALVGAWYKNSGTGAAYVFTRSGTTWTQQQKLTAGRLHLNLKDLEQIGFTPASLVTLGFETEFERFFLFKEIEGNVTKNSEILGGVAETSALLIFAESEVEDPMQAVFNVPVSAHSIQQNGCRFG